MRTILGELDTRLKEMLAPLLQINGWEVTSITTEDFSNAENFNALVERYRTALPGAFLSFPRITFQAVPPTVPHFTADYQLLVGSLSRNDMDKAHDFAFRFMERACGLVYRQKIEDIDLPAELRYIQPRQFFFGEVDTSAGVLGTALYTFSIEVRNWKVNNP